MSDASTPELISSELGDSDRGALEELVPLLRRAADLDARSLVRIRLRDAATVLVRLPFRILVSRRVESRPRGVPLDITVRALDMIAWVDRVTTEPPGRRDAEWRTGLPPNAGWTRLERVPDSVVRPLVRSGAQALQDAAIREGVPGAQPRAEVADAVLDSAVLTVSDDAGTSAPVTLRALSALTRMGFLPVGGSVFVDTAGRWIRVVAEYGTVYLERPGNALTLS